MLGEILNKKFGKAYIKNLKDSNERRDFITKNFDSVGLKYQIFEAFNGMRFMNSDYMIRHGSMDIGYPASAGFWGNQITTLHILMREFNDDTDSCMIFDDDSYFYNFEKTNEIIQTIETNLPDDWDIIIFGGLREQHFSNIDYVYRKVNKHEECAGCHGTAVNKRAYAFLINHFHKMDYWGDGVIGHFHDSGGKIYYLEPNICGQNRKLFSDVNKIYHSQ